MEKITLPCNQSPRRNSNGEIINELGVTFNEHQQTMYKEYMKSLEKIKGADFCPLILKPQHHVENI